MCFRSLLVFPLAWVCSIKAQPTYMRVLAAPGTAQENLNELTSGNLLVGMAYQSGSSLIDNTGNILHSHCYDIDTFLVLQSVEKYSDNEFYFTGSYYKDSCTVNNETGHDYYPVIGCMDSMGNVISMRYYVLNGICWNPGGDLEVFSDKSVAVWGRDYRFFLLRADSTGTPLWAKRFNQKGAFQFVRQLPGGDFIAGINMDISGAVIARLTPSGDFVWCKSYIRPRGMLSDCVIESDDSFRVIGLTDTTSSTDIFTPYPPDYHPKLFMLRLNGAGEVQWCKGYDTPYTWYSFGGIKMAKTVDGKFVVLSNLGYANYHRWYRPLLMKFDQNGDTLWTRSIGRGNCTYQTSNMLVYSDGGFIYNGVIWGNDLPGGTINSF